MTEYRLPWYARATFVLLGLTLLTIVLVWGRDIFVPLAFGAMVSVLLHPLSSFLERHKVPRLLAIFIAVAIASLVFAALTSAVVMQVGQFAQDIPRLRERSGEHLARLQEFMQDEWGFTYKDQVRWFEEWGAQALQRAGQVVGQTLVTFMDITMLLTLVPLYAFLMLMYKELIIEFFFGLIAGKNAATLVDVLHEARATAKNYLIGLMIQTIIIAILNSSALLLLGIDHAILFGILAALLNLIPYVGIMIGGLFPMLMAVITKDSAWYPFGVIVSFVVIQVIDNNLIVPYIVAARIRINALISIVAVIFGGMVWGISGMFLSLPAIAILKIVFDRTESMKPWGMILGDDIPLHRTGKAAKL